MFLITYTSGGESTTVSCSLIDEVFDHIAGELFLHEKPGTEAFCEELSTSLSFFGHVHLEALVHGQRITLDLEDALVSLATNHTRAAFSRAIHETYHRLHSTQGTPS